MPEHEIASHMFLDPTSAITGTCPWRDPVPGSDSDHARSVTRGRCSVGCIVSNYSLLCSSLKRFFKIFISLMASSMSPWEPTCFPEKVLKPG